MWRWSYRGRAASERRSSARSAGCGIDQPSSADICALQARRSRLAAAADSLDADALTVLHQPDFGRARGARIDQAVGNLAFDGARHVANAALHAAGEGIDRPHQNLRINAAAGDSEAELLCDGLDLQCDDARDVQPLE